MTPTQRREAVEYRRLRMRPWSSAAAFVERVGRETASKIWREYPVLDYGKKWDVD
ncbi:MAG TPA: hypothetical protein VFZ40_13865 [Pyrinomonadaceae bacterium]